MIGTLVAITLRGLLNRRRTLWLGLLGALIIGVAALFRLADQAPGEAGQFTVQLLGNFGIAVLLPVVTVIVGTAALGSEIEDGTIIYLLGRPVPRWRILVAKLVVSWLLASVLVATPILIAGAITGVPELGGAYGAGAVLGALEYTAIFVALSLVTSRALVIGLAYVIVWEGIVGGLLAGTRLFSVRQHVLALAEELGGEAALSVDLDIAVALAMSLIVIVGATVIGIRRLETVELRGETA